MLFLYPTYTHTHTQEVVPVLVGSSYKNVGVQPMMNAVVDYLPSPRDCIQPPALNLYAPNLCALAFKILHDRQKGGILTYLRVYSGRLEKVCSGVFHCFQITSELLPVNLHWFLCTI